VVELLCSVDVPDVQARQLHQLRQSAAWPSIQALWEGRQLKVPEISQP
jgi:hypothetical protein